MEESRLLVYFDYTLLSDGEMYVDSEFGYLAKPNWFENDFATFCIEQIDGNKHVKGSNIISPYLGYISPVSLSGGTKTLIAAYNNKDKIYPLENLGDNCAEALYLSGIGTPTRWLYEGYFPAVRNDQIIEFVETGKVIRGSELTNWELYEAPECNGEDFDYMSLPLPEFPSDEEVYRANKKPNV